MLLFQYDALDAQGNKLQGTEEAGSREAALDQLEHRHLFVTRLEEKEGDEERQNRFSLSFLRPISAMDLVLFNRRLATLVASGIPLLESLNAIERQLQNQRFRLILHTVKEDVRGGKSFSEAIARHPAAFPQLMVSMVRVGETGGILAPVLEQLADFTERDNEIRSEVRTAMAYPALVLVLATGTVIFLMTSVIPRLSQMFEGMQVTLPLPTRVLMGMSDLVIGYGWIILVLLAAGGVAFWRMRKAEAFKEKLDTWKLRIPLFGSIVQKAIIARFARSLGALARGGVPLMEGLYVVNKVLNNITLSHAVDRIMERVRKGDSMAHGLQQEPLFPDLVKYMISAGEETGKLDEMLFKIADIYEMESRQAIKVTVTLLAPILILVVAGVVLFIALAMLLPIFQINQMIG